MVQENDIISQTILIGPVILKIDSHINGNVFFSSQSYIGQCKIVCLIVLVKGITHLVCTLASLKETVINSLFPTFSLKAKPANSS